MSHNPPLPPTKVVERPFGDLSAAEGAFMGSLMSQPTRTRSAPRPAPDIEAAIRLIAGWEPLGVTADPVEAKRRNPLIYAAQEYLDPH